MMMTAVVSGRVACGRLTRGCPMRRGRGPVLRAVPGGKRRGMRLPVLSRCLARGRVLSGRYVRARDRAGGSRAGGARSGERQRGAQEDQGHRAVQPQGAAEVQETFQTHGAVWAQEVFQTRDAVQAQETIYFPE